MPARPAVEPKADRGSVNTLSALAGSSRVAEIAPESEGTGQPGNPQLEGVQSPQLMIQKSAPKEIQVGKPASFRVTRSQYGPDSRLRSGGPRSGAQGRRDCWAPRRRPSQRARGEIVWTLGTIRPGEESSVEMQLMPTAEGEIGSVATVQFGADASARSVATRPQLVVETTAPGKVLIGEQVTLTITVSNPGTGVATGVVLDERIPPGLQHPAGTRIGIRGGRPEAGREPQAGTAAGGQSAGPDHQSVDRPRRGQPPRREQAATSRCWPRSWTCRWKGRSAATWSVRPPIRCR